MIYLDDAASAPVRRAALEAAWPLLAGLHGNPGSGHAVGLAARDALEDARARVARQLGVRGAGILFTSGGTESDNTAVKGIPLASRRGRHVIVSAVEHPAVLESARALEASGGRVSVLPVDATGLVDPGDVERAIRSDTALISIQHANSEIGTVQPLAELAAIAAAHGVPMHSDAVQSAGVLPLRVPELGVSALSIAGHKLGAPKGVGVLQLSSRLPIDPLIHGGGQQRGRRSGTESPALAVALAVALEECRAEMTDTVGDGGIGADTAGLDPSESLAGGTLTGAEVLSARRDAFIAAVLDRVPGARLSGHARLRLPGHASFTFAGVAGEAILVELETAGVICSSGSACATGSDVPSPVLTALGLDDGVAQTAVRFSFGLSIPGETLLEVAEMLGRVIDGLRGR